MRFEAVRVRSIFYDAEEQKMPSNVVTKTTSPEGKAETERPIDTLGRERETDCDCFYGTRHVPVRRDIEAAKKGENFMRVFAVE